MEEGIVKELLLFMVALQMFMLLLQVIKALLEDITLIRRTLCMEDSVFASSDGSTAISGYVAVKVEFLTTCNNIDA